MIGGKAFTLSGNESEEYLQKVASYINGKMEEYSKMGTFTRQPMDTQNVLIQLNIADDYFKAKKICFSLSLPPTELIFSERCVFLSESLSLLFLCFPFFHYTNTQQLTTHRCLTCLLNYELYCGALC